MLSLWGIGVRPEDGLIYLFSTDMRSRAARLRRRSVTVGVSFLDNLGRVTPSASWSDSAAQSVLHATRFRSGRTVSCIPIARSRALRLFSSGLPFGESVR